MKKLKVILTSLLVTAVALTFATASVVANGFVFEDDFESYSVGTVPSPNWYASAYYGGQPYDYKVRLFEGNKVFALYSGYWVAMGSAQIDPLLDYSFEADIYMMPRSTGNGNGPGLHLRTVNRNTYHPRGGYSVHFDPYLNRVGIYISDYPNTNIILGEIPYELNFDTWYKVKARVTGDTYGDITIQAFVNDMVTPILEVVDDGSKWVYYRGDVAGYTNLYNGYSGLIYHDNIKIYEVSPAPPVADPNGPYLGAKGEPIPFDGTGSSDADDDPLTYEWDWGDDSPTGSGDEPSHTYTEVGIYDMCLTVNDGYEDSAEVCTYVVVFDPDGGFVTGGGWIDSPAGAYYPSDLPLFDGSYYEMVQSEGPLNWFEARDTAAGLTYGCCTSAHLATITSQEEYDTVLVLFGEYPGGWLGGFQEEGVYPADIGWQWVTGEPFEFEAWLDGEPNDSPFGEYGDAAEQQLEMYPTGWNDVPGDSPRHSFVVEYEDCDPTGKATFGFVSKYKKGADVPEGNTEFQFKAGDLNFHSDHYKWLIVTGSNYAKFMGKGTINGEGINGDLYRFQIWAGDNTPDTFRIKIWWEDTEGEHVVYDNGMDQAIGGGSIVIHTK